MLCVVIKGPSYEKAWAQMQAARACADILELRVDLFSSIELSRLSAFCSLSTLPIILTLRSASQGGNALFSKEKRHGLLLRLAQLSPDYLDIEYPTDLELLATLPILKFILSYHGSVNSFPALYEKMQKTPAHFYKIATPAADVLDALNLLLWTKQNNTITISMGPAGQISRILSPCIHNPLTYATLDEDPASPLGQLSAQRLLTQYAHASLTPEASLYGLIGDPIIHSISDHTHNAFFQSQKLNAVYVKMPVSVEQIDAFLALAKQLPFKGISVTMPLKETLLPHLTRIDKEAQEIGAVNTLVLQNTHWVGYNTDGQGALNALEKHDPVRGKHLLFIGAGGAAKAIAHEAHKRGARLMTFLNRNVEKAKKLASLYRGQADALDSLSAYAKQGYDILIYCCPADLPINPEHLLPDALILDIRTQPKETPLLLDALKKGCRVVYGYDMFLEQALLQFALWGLPPAKKPFLENVALQILSGNFSPSYGKEYGCESR